MGKLQYSFGLLDLRFLSVLCNFLLNICRFLLINFLYDLFSSLSASSFWGDFIFFSLFFTLMYWLRFNKQSQSNHGLFCFLALGVLLLFEVCLEMPVSSPAWSH